MSDLLWIFAASIAANVLLLIWWLLARQRADHHKKESDAWRASSREWEGTCEAAYEANAELRREIVGLAKPTTPAAA